MSEKKQANKQNGKGDKPRPNCFSDDFKENYDLIDWQEDGSKKKKVKDTGSERHTDMNRRDFIKSTAVAATIPAISLTCKYEDDEKGPEKEATWNYRVYKMLRLVNTRSRASGLSGLKTRRVFVT